MDNTQKLALYAEAKDVYYNGETTLMSDADFDALELELVDASLLTTTVIGAPERAGKVHLPTPMGSLDQLRTATEIQRFAAKYPNEVMVISEKIDGNSLLLQYKSGQLTASFSRGDGTRGANNLRHSQQIESVLKKLPFQFTGTIRGEIVVAKRNWPSVQATAAALGKVYANSRNFVAGFMNALESDTALYPFLTFVAYQVTPAHSPALDKLEQFSILSRAGFTTPEYLQRPSQGLTEHHLVELTRNMIAQSDYELDGCVIEVNNGLLHVHSIDPNNLNPVHGRKFKVISEAASAETVVIQVEWNISKHGLLKPLIHFTPISLDGATITKATGHNARLIQDQGIGIGAIIRIARSGGVIPKLIGVVKRADFVQPPNSAWNDNQVELISITESSPEEQIEQLTYFFQKLEVDGASSGAAEKLHASGVNTWVDLLCAPQSMYVSAIGAANGKKVFKNLHAALSNVSLAKFAAASCAFDFGIGERKITDVLNQLGLDGSEFTIFTTTHEQFRALGGIQDISAGKLVAGFDKLHDQLNALNARGGPVPKFSNAPQRMKKSTSGKFINQVVCTTGVRLTPEQKSAVIALGGEVTDTLSSSVTILIAKDPTATSAKLDKARACGVQILSLAEFVEGITK
jgi:DNA ligase (NAD+)